jgi:hypothetical protein
MVAKGDAQTFVADVAGDCLRAVQNPALCGGVAHLKNPEIRGGCSDGEKYDVF